MGQFIFNRSIRNFRSHSRGRSRGRIRDRSRGGGSLGLGGQPYIVESVIPQEGKLVGGMLVQLPWRWQPPTKR